MLLLLSGEGASDLGVSKVEGGNSSFAPGPLALVVDQMVQEQLDFSPIAFESVVHISRVQLAAAAKSMVTRPPVVIPGAKRPAGNAGDYRQAYALAEQAKELEHENDEPVVAIVFRDSDGTQTDSRTRWDVLVAAINGAFAAAEFPRGVPMVAKPKQEAWFVCALKDEPYFNCAVLEERSGNDNSPNSLKGALRNLGCEGTAEALIELVESGRFDHSRLDMPSFNEFRIALNAALELCRKPT